MKPFGKTLGSLALGLALTLTAGALRADGGGAGDSGPQRIEKRRIVMVDDNGKTQVFDGDGMSFKRGFLGVGLTDLTPELRKHFGAPEDAGVMVSSVESGSPADKAGLKVGDILTSIDGAQVDSSFDVSSRVRKIEDGHQVGLEAYRDGRSQKLTATIVERERPAIDMGPLFFKEKDGKNIILKMDKDKVLSPEMRMKMKMETLDDEDGDGHHVMFRRLGSPREAELEKQLKELEKRIAELEKALAKKN